MGDLKEFKPRPQPLSSEQKEQQRRVSSTVPINFSQERYFRTQGYEAIKRESQQRQFDEEMATGTYTEIIPNSTVLLEAVRVVKARRANKIAGRIQSAAIEAGIKILPSSLPEAVFISTSVEKMQEDHTQLSEEVFAGDPEGLDFT